MAVDHRTRFVPLFLERADEHRRKLAQAINALLAGKSNNHFTTTLRANQITTEVQFTESRAGVVPLLVPLSASAALTIANFWTEPQDKKVIIHHDSSAATDRQVGVVIVG
jgi:hypothetical protein